MAYRSYYDGVSGAVQSYPCYGVVTRTNKVGTYRHGGRLYHTYDTDGYCYLAILKDEYHSWAEDLLGANPRVEAVRDTYRELTRQHFIDDAIFGSWIVSTSDGPRLHIVRGGAANYESVWARMAEAKTVGGSPLTSHEPVVLHNAFLASALASPRGGYLSDSETFRRYATNITSSTMVGGNTDSRHAVIQYEVGRRYKTVAEALLPARGGMCIDTSYDTGAALAEDFVGLAKKYSNFSATFEFSSLAGVVERLARALAVASTTAGVTSTHLRAGEPLNVQALGTYDGPVNSLTSTVFIPRLVNSSITGDVFSVLVNAVAGEGGSVATDVLEIDAVTRQPLIPQVEGDGLPRALVDGIRILGANMIASGQGPLFALAVTRGIHRTVSVVGHTDEGAITRELLRAGNFGTPFGGIHYGLTTYAGLPALSSDSPTQVAAFVDAIALTTAALVAHCDPGERFNGRWFPTFYSGLGVGEPTVRPGKHVAGTPAMARHNHAQLVAGVSRFTDNYTAGLATLFSARGDIRVASIFMSTVSVRIPPESRHLQHASIAPWFWIEPTSLIPAGFLGSVSESEGFSSFGGPNSVQTRLAWEDICMSGAGDTAAAGYHVLMRSARTSWFLAHWIENERNGLGAVRVRQLDPTGVIHPGACGSAPTVLERVEEGRPISDFLWKRGQSPFPAPGELINLTGTVGLYVRHVTLDEECVPHVEHVPASHEFVDCSITLRVGRPTGRPSGKSNFVASDARRAKTTAARELGAASARVAAFGRADVSEMPILTSAPIMRHNIPSQRDAAPDISQGRVNGTTLGSVSGGGGADEAERHRTGEPVDPVSQHAPLKAPVLFRQATGAGGGGGAQRPPQARTPTEGDQIVDRLAGDDDIAPPGLVAPPSGAAPPSGPQRQ